VTESTKDTDGGEGRNIFTIVVVVRFHVFIIERVTKSVEADGKSVLVKLDHHRNSFDGIVLVNPNALDTW
jgi:hypothetical protein